MRSFGVEYQDGCVVSCLRNLFRLLGLLRGWGGLVCLGLVLVAVWDSTTD